jgi:hypothetical protein
MMDVLHTFVCAKKWKHCLYYHIVWWLFTESSLKNDFCIEPLEVSNLSLEIYLDASIVRRIVMFVILEDYLQGFCHGH